MTAIPVLPDKFTAEGGITSHPLANNFVHSNSTVLRTRNPILIPRRHVIAEVNGTTYARARTPAFVVSLVQFYITRAMILLSRLYYAVKRERIRRGSRHESGHDYLLPYIYIATRGSVVLETLRSSAVITG